MIGQETWCSFSYCQVAMVFYGHAFEIVNFAVLNQKLPRIKFYIPFITLAFSIGLEYFWTLVGDLPTFVKSWDSRWRIQESCCLELMALLHVIWDGHSMLWSLKKYFSSSFHLQSFHSLRVTGVWPQKALLLRPWRANKRPVKIRLTWICLRELLTELIGETN